MIILYLTHKLELDITKAYAINKTSIYEAIVQLNSEYGLEIDLDTMSQDDNVVDTVEYTIEVLFVESLTYVGRVTNYNNS